MQQGTRLTKREIRQAQLRAIVENERSQTIEGCTIDPETARLILDLQSKLKFGTVYKLMGAPMAKIASIAWAWNQQR